MFVPIMQQKPVAPEKQDACKDGCMPKMWACPNILAAVCTAIITRSKMYQSTKTFGHDIGLSCCFRQWRANSHCNQLHGYALSFKFVFECEVLNSQNWAIDFGGLKALKASLEERFDHKLLVAKDDPAIDEICALSGIGVAHVLIEDKVGCEAFAHIGFKIAEEWLYDNGHAPRVWLKSCEVAEHGANSAVYLGEEQ